jgi:hypothetical protein
MTFKNKFALGIATATLTIASAVVAPQAVANSKSRHHVEVRSLQSQVDEMASMMRSMQTELARVKAQAGQASSEKVQELDQWMQSVKASPIKAGSTDHMVFFRGGFSEMNHSRGGELLPDARGVIGSNDDTDGWYFGAGFDFSINNDLFGLMDNTEVLAELMFEYKEFSTLDENATGNAVGSTLVAVANDVTDANTGAFSARHDGVTVSQFTLTAAPKIKFLKGSKLRPWVIPAGLALHMISPPSDGVTVLTPGVMFAGGLDYEIYDNIRIGADARYHLTGDVDGTRTDGYTIGGYLGLDF